MLLHLNLAEESTLLRVEQEILRVEREVQRLAAMLSAITRTETRMANTLDDLSTKLTNLTTVGDGMETLLSTLSGEVQALKTGDPAQDAKIDALAATMDSKGAEWSAALVANTPAAPTPATA